MRSSFARSFGPAVVTGLLALASAGSAIAEDAEFEDVSTDGSQIIAAGATPDVKQAKNLNTVPDDGLGPEAPKGPYNRLVRELLAARPGEDLVICVAGCYSNRDRVVYAQPMQREVRACTDVGWPEGAPAEYQCSSAWRRRQRARQSRRSRRREDAADDVDALVRSARTGNPQWRVRRCRGFGAGPQHATAERRNELTVRFPRFATVARRCANLMSMAISDDSPQADDGGLGCNSVYKRRISVDHHPSRA